MTMVCGENGIYVCFDVALNILKVPLLLITKVLVCRSIYYQTNLIFFVHSYIMIKLCNVFLIPFCELVFYLNSSKSFYKFSLHFPSQTCVFTLLGQQYKLVKPTGTVGSKAAFLYPVMKPESTSKPEPEQPKPIVRPRKLPKFATPLKLQGTSRGQWHISIKFTFNFYIFISCVLV